MQRIALLLALVATLATGLTATASAAVAPQPPLDISKLEYAPVGHFKGSMQMPPNATTACQEAGLPHKKGEIFNPSGKWNAFDNNVYEIFCLPFRGPGDKTDNDPVGNNSTQPRPHGTCGGLAGPDDPGTHVKVAGICHNHQLEWTRYWTATMKEILKDYSPTVRQYAFEVGEPGPDGNTRHGRALNTAIVVPGADNPEEHIVVGAHYDKTLDGPASAWDSQEGHAEMIRMAKLMADYWKATNTRPSATIKFIPWDAEESGVFGSEDYAKNVIVPGEEYKMRGYWNTDPCAGGYPSFRYGNPQDRLRMGIQLADPGAIPGVSAGDATRITEFNKRAQNILQQILNKIDDKVSVANGEVETFIATNENGPGTGEVNKDRGIFIGSDRPILFSSDWASFEVLGIPFFNPGPEVTGPNQETSGAPNYGPDQSADALSTFHTPNDNLQTMNRFTQFDPTGLKYSESWAKGMEFCSHLLAWGMLQHDQGGAQRVNNDVVAYYEALPNEARADQTVKFNAEGSYQIGAGNLEYSWDFGDGNTGSGITADHAYNEVGLYQSKLTVRNPATGQSDTMSIPITVLPNDLGGPVLEKPPVTDEDGTFELKFDYTGDKKDLKAYSIEESTNGSVPLAEDASTMNRWDASQDVPATVAPWQLSDSPTAKYHGNVNTSKPRSFWTGVPANQNRYQAGPEEGTSILTLKDTFQVPRGTNAALSYNSNFVNGTGDKGRVQVAIANAPGDKLEWISVDSFATGAGDADSLSVFEERQADQSGAKAIQRRFADLTKFAGRRLKMRFVYELGPHDPTFPYARPGWYVDDIRVVAGSYREIGQTASKAFTIANRRKGTYAYRIKAVFADGIKSSASNSESVEVTRGDPDGGGASARGATEGCALTYAAGYTRLAVRRTGRDLRVDLGTAAGPATVELFRVASSKRALKPKRVARLRNVTGPITIKRRKSFGTAGYYYARVTAPTATGQRDVRTFSLRLVKGRFRAGKAFTGLASCGLLSSYSLNSPVFSGKRPLTARVSTTQPARLTVEVFRGKAKKPLARFVRNTGPNRLVRLRVNSKRIRRRGEHRIVVTARAPSGETSKATLISRRM